MALTPCKECGNEVSTQAETCPKCGAKVASSSAGFGGLIISVIVVAYLFYTFSNHTGSSPAMSNVSSIPDIKQQIKGQVTFDKWDWYTTASGSIMMLNATLANHSNQDIKDVEITCNNFSNSGTKIDSNTRTVYEIVKAGKSKRIHEFNMGFIHSQAAKTDCSVSDLVVK